MIVHETETVAKRQANTYVCKLTICHSKAEKQLKGMSQKTFS